jgi:hypothetical protein
MQVRTVFTCEKCHGRLHATWLRLTSEIFTLKEGVKYTVDNLRGALTRMGGEWCSTVTDSGAQYLIFRINLIMAVDMSGSRMRCTPRGIHPSVHAVAQ